MWGGGCSGTEGRRRGVRMERGTDWRRCRAVHCRGEGAAGEFVQDGLGQWAGGWRVGGRVRRVVEQKVKEPCVRGRAGRRGPGRAAARASLGELGLAPGPSAGTSVVPGA